jgi:ring-1,2-phenylacetyl-CoA epoxidase subunit PaaC
MVSPVLRHVSERAQALLEYADDELILGWRDSEWTGIAPFLEEDVAFSSISQNEVGHARALYEIAARDLGITADELAFDRPPQEYRSAPLVELREMDWARTIARHVLYEAADEIRLEALKASGDKEVAGLAAKMDREEAYHRIHAQMWEERLRGEPRFNQALEELWPAAVAVLPEEQRPLLAERMGRELPADLDGFERGAHAEEWPALWEEMTEVRRSVPGAEW